MIGSGGRPASGATEAGVRPIAGWLALAGIVAAALALEIGLEGRDPFWLDESWTGAIVSGPSWREVFQQMYWDVNAPLYYGLMRLWSLAFGLSDVALRAPSLVFAALTPLAAAWPSTPGLTTGRRLAWAALLAFWFPALCYAEEARCYSLLLLVCTLQTAAYIRLMQRPGTGRAAVWAALASTAILTHYDALYLGAAQGLLYVARHPRRGLASWPAALAFVPAFGWLAFHAPRIAQFARPDIAWYSPLRLEELPRVGAYLADGGDPMPAWLAALAISALSLRFAPLRRTAVARSDWRAAGWAVGAAALAAVVLVGVGFLRPSFTLRYLTPSAPGLLLGLVLLVRGAAGQRATPYALAALAAVYLGVSGWMLHQRLRMAPKRYNFEAASAAIARTHPARLVFLWDHPVDPILHAAQLAGLGGFFLHRDGLEIPVDPVVLRPGETPTERLLAQAAPPGSAILWLYDVVVRGTAAIPHPPDMTRLEARFRCRPFASGRFGVLACVPRAGGSADGTSGGAAHQPRGSQPQG